MPELQRTTALLARVGVKKADREQAKVDQRILLEQVATTIKVLAAASETDTLAPY